MSNDGKGGASPPASAMIITTLSNAELLPILRSAVKGQVEGLPDVSDVNARIKDALERISISRVFDFDGLREALDELDRLAEAARSHLQEVVPLEGPQNMDTASVSSSELSELPEIRDSEDEDELSPPRSPGSPQQPHSPIKQAEPPPHAPLATYTVQQQHPTTPDMVIITNISTIITSLYTTRDRSHAHEMLTYLSSRLAYTTRGPHHKGPLFLLLNSTTSKVPPNPHPPTSSQPPPPGDLSSPPSTPLTESSTTSSPPHSPSDQLPPTDPSIPTSPAGREREDLSHISSLFNPPPPDPATERGEEDEYGYARHPDPDYRLLERLARRNKPFFGTRFGGMVDLHLLATRVPGTERGAGVYFGGLGVDGTGEVDAEGVGLVWVVEVLGDGRGVWVWEWEGEDGVEVGERGEGAEGEGSMGRRFYREERWAGVEVREENGGLRVVDAGGQGVDVAIGERDLV